MWGNQHMNDGAKTTHACIPQLSHNHCPYSLCDFNGRSLKETQKA